MKGFLVVLVVLVLVAAAVGGLGYSLGWFHLTVDREKFQEDRKDVMDRMQDFGGSFKDKSAAPPEEK